VVETASMTPTVSRIIVLFALAGCGASEASKCVEGASAACACPDGRTGAQVCDSRGVFGACSCNPSGDGGASPGDGGASSGDGAAGSDAPVAHFPALDILFLVDNSPSMAEEQNNLRRNFPVLIDELRKIPGGQPDLHIGVVSSDLGAGSKPLTNGGCPRTGGDRGIYQARPECGLMGGALFAASTRNGASSNFAGDISTVFSCMAQLGTVGCGYEHQLQSIRVALDEQLTPQNKGFLREEALLAIVIITDEDDCSAPIDSDLFTDDASFPMTSASFRCSQVGHLCSGKSPPVGVFDDALENCTANPGGRLIKVAEIVDSIRAVKKRPDQQILVSGVFGWPAGTGARYRYVQASYGIDVAPICESPNGEAAVGLRLKAFVESFGASGSFFSICNGDFSPALKAIGEKLAVRL
jgi:hypothetical protein